MATENYIKPFQKYISQIIMPKYPEINDFDIEFREKSEWNYYTAQWMNYYKIILYVDGTDSNLERDINDSLGDMKAIFGLDSEIFMLLQLISDNGVKGSVFVVD